MQEKELSILCMLERQRLAKISEIRRLVGPEDGGEDAIRSLVIADSIRAVEPIGEKCFVITPEGSRRLKEIQSAARARQEPVAVREPAAAQQRSV